MCRIVIILILISTSSLPLLAQSKPQRAQFRYKVDATQAAKRLLTIQVQINGLPEGENVLAFRDSEDSLSQRVTRINQQPEEGSESLLSVQDGRFIVESTEAETVRISFQLRSESFQNLDRATYVDARRCVFHPQDILLQIANQEPKVVLSFVLPTEWKAVGPLRPSADGTFSVHAKQVLPFYLGKAEEARDDDLGPLSIAIEPGWPPAPEAIAALRQQLHFRRRANPSAGAPLLAVFLEPSSPLPVKDALGSPSLLALAIPPDLSDPLVAIRKTHQTIARGFVRTQLPAISDLSAILDPEKLINYLALKSCLKTGVLGRAEFLNTLAVELWNSFGEPAETLPKPRAGARPARNAAPTTARSRYCGLLLDLAFSLYGENIQSLDGFLSTEFATPAADPITEAMLRRRLRREPKAAAALAGIWQEDPQTIGDLLRPHGLLFEHQELPVFDFQLNETFHISRLETSTGRAAPLLEPGDRIIAIGNRHLLLPDDLLKSRSHLVPGQEVQLEVERQGVPMRVTQRVTKQVVVRLEINKLADADKQLKLERFLGAETTEN